MNKTVVELFAGVGGFRVGLNNVKGFNSESGLAIENNDWDFVWANQYEPSTKKQDAYDCYVTRFGQDSCSNEDISIVNKENIPDHNLVVGGFPCLTGDTMVMTKKGEVQLSNIHKNDLVLSHDGNFHKVLNFFNQGEKKVYMLKIKGYRPIFATENHRFLVRERFVKYDKNETTTSFSHSEWMSVRDMDGKDIYFAGTFSHLIGTQYFTKTYDWKPLESITESGIKQVYDIEVQDTHSFVANGLITHNCQDYSVAHSLSKEKGIEGKKGVLFWQIAEVLKVKSPCFGLFENVDRLLKSPAKQRGRDFGIMLRTFYELGYNAEWRIINAADYGMPQRRKRVFIFIWKAGSKHDLNLKSKRDYPFNTLNKDGLFAQSFPVYVDENSLSNHADISGFKDAVGVSDSFQFNFLDCGTLFDGLITTYSSAPKKEPVKPIKDIQETSGNLDKYILNNKQLNKMQYFRGSKKVKRTRPDGATFYYSEGAMSPYDSLDLPSRTMLTSEASINRCSHIIPDKETNKLRFLTPVETERLQCFPDNWTDTGMSERRRYFMMGNALVTDIIRRIEPYLREIVQNE